MRSAEQEDKVDARGLAQRRSRAEPATDEAILRGLIEAHFRYTGSFRAREILTHWAHDARKFVKVFPQSTGARWPR